MGGNRQWLGWTMAIAASVAYSMNPPIGRAAIASGMNPTTLLTGRYLLATLLLGGTLGTTTTNGLRIDRHGLLACSAAGLANGATTLAYFWALSRMNASITSMLVSLYPLLVLGLLALRGERFTYRNAIRMAVGLGGIYLLVGPGGRVDGLGLILVFIAASGYALQLVLVQWFLHDYQTRTVATYVVASMTVVVVGFWLAQGAKWNAPGWQGWLAIGVLALVGTYLARLATFSAVRGIGSGQLALFAPLETLLTIFWSLLFLHERLTGLQWIGAGLILTSALLAVRRLYRPHLR